MRTSRRVPAHGAWPRAVRVVAALAVPMASGGCFLKPLQHPAPLVGQWVDSVKTTPTDTSVWILEPGGADLAMRVAQHREQGDSVFRAARPRRYGHWYVSCAWADTTNRALCFVRRLGRDGASCVRFRLDTVVVNGEARQRLFLENYRGQHTRINRVLLERRP